MSESALRRIGGLVAAVWLGATVALGPLAAATMFSVLAHAEAGRAATRLFAIDAYLGVVLGAAMVLLALRLARDPAGAGGSRFSTDTMLALGAVFCIVAGYFALQPMLATARTDASAVPSFATLHVVATAFFAVKIALIVALAWRLGGRGR